jgi:hypothetical protein
MNEMDPASPRVELPVVTANEPDPPVVADPVDTVILPDWPDAAASRVCRVRPPLEAPAAVPRPDRMLTLPPLAELLSPAKT